MLTSKQYDAIVKAINLYDQSLMASIHAFADKRLQPGTKEAITSIQQEREALAAGKQWINYKCIPGLWKQLLKAAKSRIKWFLSKLD